MQRLSFRTCRLATPALLATLCLSVLPLALLAGEGDTGMVQTHYYVKLLGTRPGWPADMTDDEKRIMEEHYLYLKDQTARGKVLLAGPVNSEFGLIVLEVKSEDEARAIMAEEPSVVQGVHTYEMVPMSAALMAYHVPQFRYPEQQSDRVLRKQVIVPAPRATVWEKWTTTEGLQSFFSSHARVDLRLGGEFEILFSMESPEGSRGSEDCRILSFLPMEMLAFEWNAPPKFPEERMQHTQVILRFSDNGDGTTTVDFSQYGWGVGGNWDGVYDYFDAAWDYVLNSLVKSVKE